MSTDATPPDILLYTTTWCPYCTMAKNLLQKLGVHWKEINIETQNISRAELMRRTGRYSVPQVVVGGIPIGGYSELYQLHSSGKLIPLMTGSSHA